MTATARAEQFARLYNVRQLQRFLAASQDKAEVADMLRAIRIRAFRI